jgi:broad specificity phosphatase PhoE
MSVLVARHAFSEANNKQSLAFGQVEARLTPEGRAQAKNLGQCFTRICGIDLTAIPVAVSELLRSEETAIEAGFRVRITNPLLNEVASGLREEEYKHAKETRTLPEAAREAAVRLLESPPAESVWIAHGLLIAGLCDVLQVAQDRSFIPKFCEIRELPL